MGHAEEIISRIKAEEIRPRPKWQIIARRVAVRSAWIFAILFGAISFSVILYVIQEAEYDLFDHAGHSRLELILGLMPFIWIVFLLVFLGLSIFGFKRAPRGYKYSFRNIFGISTISSMVIGALIFLIGGGQFAEKSFDASFDSYKGVSQRKIEIWSQPDDGYLSGKILKVEPRDLRIRDFSGKEWIITYTDAFIAGRVELVRGEQVKFIGKMLDPDTFAASEIRPWSRGKGKGPGMRRGQGPGNRQNRENHQPQNRKRGQE